MPACEDDAVSQLALGAACVIVGARRTRAAGIGLEGARRTASRAAGGCRADVDAGRPLRSLCGAWTCQGWRHSVASGISISRTGLIIRSEFIFVLGKGGQRLGVAGVGQEAFRMSLSFQMMSGILSSRVLTALAFIHSFESSREPPFFFADLQSKAIPTSIITAAMASLISSAQERSTLYNVTKT